MHRVLAYVLSSVPRTSESLLTQGGVVKLVSISVYLYPAGDRSVVTDVMYVTTYGRNVRYDHGSKLSEVSQDAILP